jgi:aspartate ammonia-lyase
MALTIKIDPAQMEQIAKLTQAVTDLSDNLAKWQGEQTAVIAQGFTDLIEVLGGTRGEEVQARIDALKDEVKTEADALEGANLTEVQLFR